MGGRPLIYQPLAAIVARRTSRDDEVDDVRSLLIAFADPAAGSAEDIAQVAETIAVACLGDNHLWQDLQLPSRAELSTLMAYWFPALKARNDRDMKWKKFLYKQLCEREEIQICKAPSCAVCSDQPVCFGPETA
ncbi:MAG: nitrogen fixation protein NifQ [Aquabacterium sp.]|nr:nitrogen fixation protein NifQ [Aquabacterium sp.]